MGKDVFCPYCKKTVCAGKIRALWLILSIPTGHLLIYLLYCLFTSGRICPECKRRIYEASP